MCHRIHIIYLYMSIHGVKDVLGGLYPYDCYHNETNYFYAQASLLIPTGTIYNN